MMPLPVRLALGRQALHLRAQGLTWVAVARELGCSRAYAVHVARFVSEGAWANRCAAKAERRRRVIDLRAQGMTVRAIVAALGTSRSTVERILREEAAKAGEGGGG